MSCWKMEGEREGGWHSQIQANPAISLYKDLWLEEKGNLGWEHLKGMEGKKVDLMVFLEGLCEFELRDPFFGKPTFPSFKSSNWFSI